MSTTLLCSEPLILAKEYIEAFVGPTTSDQILYVHSSQSADCKQFNIPLRHGKFYFFFLQYPQLNFFAQVFAAFISALSNTYTFCI